MIFQDTAGLTPANAPGNPVGLVTRKAGTANLMQPTTASKPTLARHPKGGRRNLLSYSNDLASSGWSGGSGLLSFSNAAAPGVSGQMTASRLIENTGNSSSRNRTQGIQVVAGQFYLASVIAKTFGPNTRHIHLVNENNTAFGGNPYAVLNTLTGEVTQVGGVERTAGAVDLGDGWWRLWTRAQCVSGGLAGFRVGFGAAPTSVWTAYDGDGESGMLIDGMQVELSPTMTPHQRTYSINDITEQGIPDVWHLYNDGGDSLPVALPAGEYGLAWVDVLGTVTVTTLNSDGSTPINMLRAERMVDVIIRQGAFNPVEVDQLTEYWEGLYK